MILIDEDNRQKAQIDVFVGPTLRHPERAAGRFVSSHLPDYDASEAYQKHRLQASASSRSLFDSKFLKATLFALGIYLLLSVAVAVPLIVLKSQKEEKSESYKPPNALWADGDGSIPSQFARIGNFSIGPNSMCNVWYSSEVFSSPPVYLDKMHFQLPPAGLVSIRSNASGDDGGSSFIHGQLLVDINNNPMDTNITFDVTLQSSSMGVRQQTLVCFNESGANRGLSIYVPSGPRNGTDSLAVTVHVLLPFASSSKISSLITYLPMFWQSFGDLRMQDFGRIVLEGYSQDIQSAFLQAPYISIKNLFADINGTFNVSQALSLDTLSGDINADITLAKDVTCANSTYLTLDTGFSKINATVMLTSVGAITQPTPAIPSFVAHVKTFNAPINISVSYTVETPPMPLQLFVRNNVAPATVTLDSKFQGVFNAQTKLANATVLTQASNFSPKDANIRTLRYDKNSPVPTEARGWIGLDKQQAYPGYVEVVSSLSPVILDLG